jgi:ribosomal protein S18 acetylase RimI-like enzyme
VSVTNWPPLGHRGRRALTAGRPLGRAVAGAPPLLTLLAQVSSNASKLEYDRVREVLRTPSTSILVARLDRKIVGMALLLTLTTLARTTGYVEEVVVDNAARGQHVSMALMTALLHLAATKGIAFVDLTCRPSRTIASGLYQLLVRDELENADISRLIVRH